MALFSPVGSSKVTVSPGATERSTNPLVVEVTMASAATEYSYALPEGTKKFMVLTPSGQPFKFSYTALGSANGFPVPWCNFYTEADLLLSGKTLYFQSPVASQVMKIIVWT